MKQWQHSKRFFKNKKSSVYKSNLIQQILP